MKNDDCQDKVSTHGYMIAQRSQEKAIELCRSYTTPQAQADEFAASLETEQIGIHFTTMPDDQPAQHLDLFRFAGLVHFKGDMLCQVLDRLPAIPLFLRFWHVSLSLLLKMVAQRSFSLLNGSTPALWLSRERKYTVEHVYIDKSLAILPYKEAESLTMSDAGANVIGE